MKRRRTLLDIHGSVKSFRGYLEGTEKSLNTIAGYMGDLRAFVRFLEDSNAKGKLPSPRALTLEHLESYREFLKSDGQRTNTRRRRLLTVRRFFKYLNIRNQTPDNVAARLATPYKNERIPHTIEVPALLGAIRGLPVETAVSRRNRALLWLLVESGALVSEVSKLKFSSLRGRRIFIPGKSERELEVSAELAAEIQELRKLPRAAIAGDSVFLGFNRRGPISTAITDRGVELVVKSYRQRLGLPARSPKLTPRLIRHSVAVAWLTDGIAANEVQRRLGLKSDYAFRAYAPVVARAVSARSSSATTSNA